MVNTFLVHLETGTLAYASCHSVVLAPGAVRLGKASKCSAHTSTLQNCNIRGRQCDLLRGQ